MEDKSMPQANSQPNIPAPARALTPSKRKRIEDRIEQLLAVLDDVDGDPDLEPSLSGNGGYGIPTGHDLEYDPADPPEHQGIDDNELEGTGRCGDSDDDEPRLPPFVLDQTSGRPL
jgi:hypothetical protein